MAVNGSFVASGGYNGRSIEFSWERTGYDLNSNPATSTIKWSLKGVGGPTSTWYYAGITLVINGATVYATTSRVQVRYDAVVSDGYITIAHNDDGSKNFDVSLSASIYSYSTNCTGNSTFTLDSLPRASVPTVSADSVVMGTSVNIQTNSHSAGFAHIARYRFVNHEGDSTGSEFNTRIVIGNGAWSFTPSVNLASQIPLDNFAYCTVYVRTFSNESLSTQVGTEQEVSFKLYVPDVIKPTITNITTSVQNTNPTIRDNWGNIAVAGYSYILYNIYATRPTNGSPIQRGWFKFGDKTVQGTTGAESPDGQVIVSGETDNLAKAGTIRPAANVVDARGRYSGLTELGNSVEVYDHAIPKITNAACRRGKYINGVWEDNDYAGSDLKVTFMVSVSSIAGHNSASTQVSCTGEVLQTVDGTGSHTIYFTTIGTDDTRVVEIKAVDSLGSWSPVTSIKVPSVKVPLNINFGGLLGGKDGVCFGGVASIPETVESKWPIIDANSNRIMGYELDSSFVTGSPYYGMTVPESSEGWIRTPPSGLLPHHQDHQLGYSDIGQAEWPFKRGYFQRLWLNGVEMSSIEAGTSNGWKYVKYSNGVIHGWYCGVFYNVSTNSAWGSIYESAQSYSMPTIYVPGCDNMARYTVECAGTEGGGVLGIEVLNKTSDHNINFLFTRAKPTTDLGDTMTIYVVGRFIGY